jgi:hypothetical protein
MYTAAEYAEILIIYGECSRNAREDAREYAIRFPRRLPYPYFYGWCTVIETLGPWCLPDKKMEVPREKLERQRLKMLFFSPLMTTVEEVYLKNYIYHEPINILEELGK